MSDIRAVFSRLLQAQNMSIDANDQIKADMQRAREFQKSQTCESQEYKDIAQYLVAEYNRNPPVNIRTGTVGEYLFACITPSTAINVKCTPNCINNAFFSCGNGGCNSSPSYHKNGDNIVKLNDVTSEDVYLFLIPGQTFTLKDRTYFANNGVKTVTIYNRDGETINYVRGETIDVTAPPPADQVVQPGWGWGWLWIVIIIILVLMIVAFLARGQLGWY